MRKLQVKVKPGAKVESLTEQQDGTWLAQVKAPPVDGKANTALVALISKHLGIRKAQVEIKSGAGGRLKQILIKDD